MQSDPQTDDTVNSPLHPFFALRHPQIRSQTGSADEKRWQNRYDAYAQWRQTQLPLPGEPLLRPNLLPKSHPGFLRPWLYRQLNATIWPTHSASRKQLLRAVGLYPSLAIMNWNECCDFASDWCSQQFHLGPSSLLYGQLQAWLNAQHTAHAQGELTPDQQNRWQLVVVKITTQWNESLSQLIEWFITHMDRPRGPNLIPADDPDPKHQGLGAWVAAQRDPETWNRLTPEQQQKLTALGIVPSFPFETN